METAYAQALSKVIERGMEPGKAIAELKKSLEHNNRSSLLPKIARAFSRIAARQGRKNTMTLSIARKKDAAHALRAAQTILAEQGIGETDLCEIIDESLIGGWRLEGRGLLVDQSWKKSLLSMYNAVTQ